MLGLAFKPIVDPKCIAGYASVSLTYFVSIAFCTGLLIFGIFDHAAADDAAAGRAEMRQAILAARPHPSLETYPVDFSINGVNYRAPRNYLTTMDNWKGGPQVIVTIRINLPDLKPLSNDTLACFAAKRPNQLAGCKPLSVMIDVPGRPSADEAFERMKVFFNNKFPISGPGDLEKYEFGPTNGRTEIYKKLEGGVTRLYDCYFTPNTDERNGICQPVGDRTSTGAVLKFFFSPSLLNEITVIDAKLRTLVESFALSTGGE